MAVDIARVGVHYEKAMRSTTGTRACCRSSCRRLCCRLRRLGALRVASSSRGVAVFL